MPKKNTKFGASHHPYSAMHDMHPVPPSRSFHSFRGNMGGMGGMGGMWAAARPKTALQWFRIFAEFLGIVSFFILIAAACGWTSWFETVCDQGGGCGSPCGSTVVCGSPAPCEPCEQGSPGSPESV